jgi:hypothetical protein
MESGGYEDLKYEPINITKEGDGGNANQKGTQYWSKTLRVENNNPQGT